MAEKNKAQNVKKGQTFLDEITKPPKEFSQGFEQLRRTFEQRNNRSGTPSPVSEAEEPVMAVVEAIIEHASAPSRLDAIPGPSWSVDVGTVTSKQDVPDADESIIWIPRKEHLLDWSNNPQHNDNFYNGASNKSRQPRQIILRNRSGIAKFNHCNLCTCMSGNPRFAALHTYIASGVSSNYGEEMPGAAQADTEAEDIFEKMSEEITDKTSEEHKQVQPEMETLRVPNQCDPVLLAERSVSEDKVPARTCLKVTSFRNKSRQFDNKWLIDHFSRFPGYRGYTVNAGRTRAQVYYKCQDQVEMARRNLHGTPLNKTESLNIEIVEIVDSLEDLQQCWVKKLCCCCCLHDSTSEEDESA